MVLYSEKNWIFIGFSVVGQEHEVQGLRFLLVIFIKVFESSDFNFFPLKMNEQKIDCQERIQQSHDYISEFVSTTYGYSPSGRHVLSSKTRIRWTQDLHQKFVECVNCLGGAYSK